jgi:hypothetical protein
MRLSPFRESRVFDVVDVQADLGAPFVSLRSLETTLFPGVLRDGCHDGLPGGQVGCLGNLGF